MLAALLLLVMTASCKNDKFLVEYRSDDPGRFNKNYKMDTGSSESFAVDVDVLWVIDNSGSMGPYQQRVINNSAAFIQQFAASSRLRWKMGLISTDTSENPYMGFTSLVDYQTLDAANIFNSAVGRLGTLGDPFEKTFEPTVQVLSNYPNWMRPNAYFVLIIVSDELEQSRMTTSQFISNIQARLGGNPNRFLTYGVYSSGSNDSLNQKYNEIVQRTNGKVYPLDSPDYGVLLAALGKDLVQKTTVVYPVIMLDQKPRIGTIQVVYKGRVLKPGAEWVYIPDYNLIQIQDPNILDSKMLDVNVSFEVEI